MSKISIIVPVYKVEKYLDECVQSILNQTFTDFELILVDDGSPDNCPAMCDLWAKKDKRIRVIHKENQGAASARKTGVEKASAEFITFVDGDDFIHPGMLEKLYLAQAENNSDYVQCGFVYKWENREAPHCYKPAVIERRDIQDTLIPDYIMAKTNVQYEIGGYSCGFLCRRNILLLAMVDMPEELTVREDRLLTLKILVNCNRIAIMGGDGLYYYRQREDSLSYTTAERWFEQSYLFWNSFMETASANGYISIPVEYCVNKEIILRIMPLFFDNSTHRKRRIDIISDYILRMKDKKLLFMNNLSVRHRALGLLTYVGLYPVIMVVIDFIKSIRGRL